MKKTTCFFFTAAIVTFLTGFSAYGQEDLTFIMSVDTILTTCEGVLYDSGGAGPAGYGAAEDVTVTLCPEDGSNVYIEWSVVDLDPAAFIYVHDGDNIFAPTIASSGVMSFEGQIHLASNDNPSGCLTIHFISSANPGATGNFAAIIHCGQPCNPPLPVVNANNPSPLYVCPGESVSFNAAGSIPGDSPIETYQWDFNGDGELDASSDNALATWTFDVPGIELVQLSLVDADECESVQPTNYFVYISTEPEWSTTVVETACTGEAVALDIQVEGASFTLEPGADFGEAIELPDNVGSCFTSDININSFLPNSVLVDASEGIENFFINIEHSFLGDLDVTFICPDGTEFLVHSYNGLGPGTDLGIPVLNDNVNPIPGEGWDYYWSSTATNGTWADPDQDGVLGSADVTLPSGVYASETSWSVLDGCPLNGIWQLEICDLWANDNGFAFEWGIDFADSLYPVSQSFTPQFGLLCDSTFWEPGADSNTVLAGDWNCADVTVTNGEAGPQTYTATAINNFGCTYSQTFEVEYVEFSPTIQASSDIFCGQAVELEMVLANEVEGDVSVVWGPEEFLSDTVGTSVFVSGLDEPELFTATVGQSFDAYPGLLCQAQSQIVIGTCEIIIPNVVSPYGSNSLNDRFAIPGIQSYPDVQLTVMNRWGNVVFQSDDFAEQPFWDCAADGASSGVYYYVLTIPVEQGPLVVTDINGQGVEYEGEGPFVFEGIFHIVD